MLINPTPTATTDALLTPDRTSEILSVGEIHLESTLGLDATPAAENTETKDSVTQYLDLAARWPRLDAAEELRLGRLVKAGRDADGNLTAEAKVAHDLLVTSNLRLVYHAARQYTATREEAVELTGAGHLALMQAARKYDADKSFRFSTYAYWGIRSAIMAELNFTRRTVRLPKNIQEQLAKLRKESARLRQELSREPDDTELETALSWSAEKLAEMQGHQQYGCSLDAPIGEEHETTLGDTLKDDATESPLEATIRNDEIACLYGVLSLLPEREREIVLLRNGIGGPEETLEAIGERFNVSRERIRQLEEGAMRKLRQAAQA